MEYQGPWERFEDLGIDFTRPDGTYICYTCFSLNPGTSVIFPNSENTLFLIGDHRKRFMEKVIDGNT